VFPAAAIFVPKVCAEVLALPEIFKNLVRAMRSITDDFNTA